MLLAVGFVNAQETAEISDEELTRYAEAMDSLDRLQGIVSKTIKDMVSTTEDIAPSRYNDLYKISKDSVKLAEAEATEMEVMFLQKVDAYKDSMTASIKSTFSSLAKDYVGDGGRVYNKIRKALKSDAEVKARYEAILEQLKTSSEEDNSTGDTN